MKISSICYAHIGHRETYEDNSLLDGTFFTDKLLFYVLNKNLIYCNRIIDDETALFAICDGMGGHNAGEVASRICVEKLNEFSKQMTTCNSLDDLINHLQICLNKINQLICHHGDSNNDLSNLGTTVVLLVKYKNCYAVLNIGDSRAYQFVEDELTQITVDHTEGQRLLSTNLMTAEEIEEIPNKKRLYRYLGDEASGKAVYADVYHLKKCNGLILLCSDGVTDSLSDDEIACILSKDIELKDKCKELVKKAIKKENSDNTTAMLIDLGDGERKYGE